MGILGSPMTAARRYGTVLYMAIRRLPFCLLAQKGTQEPTGVPLFTSGYYEKYPAVAFITKIRYSNKTEAAICFPGFSL